MRIALKLLTLAAFALLSNTKVKAQKNAVNTITADQSEKQYRPRIHFTPPKGWMNDPNGMFYKDGIYHLYYQHNPDSNVWGPMHWGHATSANLIQWKHEPIAIYPDSIGMIFSGSAVVDVNNTSGFGINGKAPIVAIFTQHNMQGEKLGMIDFQTQSIAYSNDNGYTWKMYAANPVIKNPGIKDFRDPKVMWHEASQKWIMTLAVKNKVSFYSSPNLKDWTKESDFGENLGNHGGVWECPDLFSLQFNNKTYWVLTSSINPGGPNKGSATQYFIGEFDGHTFSSSSTKTKWMDYGTDNYAGVTFSNTGSDRISIGWMSNWMYAQQVPTVNWRSAATLPRNLSIAAENGELYLASNASKYLLSIAKNVMIVPNGAGVIRDENRGKPFKINFEQEGNQPFTFVISNTKGQHIKFGYDAVSNQYFIDRTAAGDKKFHPEFAAKHVAPRISNSKNITLYAVLDKTSIELFADNGMTVMTDIFFPAAPFSKIKIETMDGKVIKNNFQLTTYLTP